MSKMFLSLSEHKGSLDHIKRYVEAKSIFHKSGDVTTFSIYPDPPHIYQGPPTIVWVLYIKIHDEHLGYDPEYRIYETNEEAYAGRMLHNFI